MSTPVLGQNGALLAVLAGRLEMNTIRDVVSRRAGRYQSEDTYLVSRGGMPVTVPRTIGRAFVLERNFRAQTLAPCFAGGSGVVTGSNFNGIASINAYRWLAEYSLCLITKIDEAEALQPVNRLAFEIIFLGAIVFAFAGLLGYILSRIVTRPIAEMRAGVQRIAAGELIHRLSENSRDELGDLARDVNTMTQTLQDSEQRFRELADTASDWFWEMDADLRYTYLSRSLDGYFTDPRDNPLGRTRQELYGGIVASGTAGEQESWRRHFADLEARRPFKDFVQRWIASTGETLFFMNNGTPFFDQRGEFAGYRGTSSNVTERVLAEQNLRVSEARYSGILEIAPDAIITADEFGIIQMFNQRAQDIFGLNEDETLGQSIEMLMPARFRNDHARNIAEFGNSGVLSRRMSERGGIFGLCKDGSEFPAEASVSRLETDHGVFFNVILRDVTDRKRIENELIEAKLLAEVASGAKSEFLAGMSHELRTPMNAILGFSEVMASESFGPLGSERYKEYANDIHASGALLLDLINDVLDLSKIEAGALELAADVVDLNATLRSALRLVNERAERKLVRIDTRLDPSEPTLRGDERALKQIALNLLSNSVKFTAEGGVVTLVTESQSDGGILLIVADTGIGIALTDIPKVLEPFGQIESARTRGHEGTGLGLSIAKRLTEMLDATFELESEPGVGTTIRLRFPPERHFRTNDSQVPLPA